jgi:hypothetical protein
MLRPLFTYLLILNLFTISLLNVREEVPVYESWFTAKELVKKECSSFFKEHSLYQKASHTSHPEDAEMLETMPLEYENEIELESHIFGIPFISEITYTHLSTSIHAYHAYELLIVKVQHQDIFSPPPNC